MNGILETIPVAKTMPAWDDISPEDLRPLGGSRPMTTEFGYLFRHYWTSENELRYRMETRQVFPDGEECRHSQTTSRTLARCDADLCLWREKILEESGDDGLIRFSPFGGENYFCEYDRSKQIFKTKPVLAHEFQQATEEEAGIQAFLRQPIMAPLLPIPVGFRWHVKNESGQLDFTLESAVKIENSTVLFVRRKGFAVLTRLYRNYETCEQRLFLDREGLTAYELESSLVLEDRVCDQFKFPSTYAIGRAYSLHKVTGLNEVQSNA